VTIGDALAQATSRLAEAGVESARLEAELLLAKACDDCARALLYAELNREMTEEQVGAFDANLKRRESREPLAYILGEWGFRRLTLKTDRRALIPRPETEVVVERALEHIRDLEEPRVLDVGTGTGAIALAIADEAPRARVTAMDVSSDALALAAREALRPGGWLVLETAAGAGDRVEHLLSDFGFDHVGITPDLAGRDRVAEGRWPL
jgi:release factor glutamine methyltransferase